ncbi:fumarylacetoacetate hydrolase family protein [Gordonia terrae]
MRLATLSNRVVLIEGERAIDVESAPGSTFGSRVAEIYERWDEFSEWYRSNDFTGYGEEFDPLDLGAPSPAPAQVFAIGLNYSDHAAEAGVKAPIQDAVPPTFTKYRSSLVGPYTELRLPSDRVDWEVELVAVIGRRAQEVSAGDAWDYVAGLTVGQDYSERDIQRLGPVPQFSMGKSFPGFGPTGPWLVTPDEFDDPDDLEIECLINGETVQKARTSSLIVSVTELVEKLSAVCTLLPGDVIFTGTPAGVGLGRTPEEYLNVGDEIVSRIGNIGELRQTCVQ